MRRIVFLLPSLAGGGAERVALNLATAMASMPDWRVDLVVLDRRGSLANRVPSSVVLHDLGTVAVRRSLPRLLRLLRRFGYDAAFSTFMHLNLPLLVMRPLLPRALAVVLREANLPSLSLARLSRSSAWRLAARSLYPVADAVLASSERMADELSALGARADRIYRLDNPVDEFALRAAADPPQRQGGSGRGFVAAGRLVPQKGFDTLIEMAKCLSPDDRIDIYGDGPERESLKALARPLGGRVRFRGYSSNLPATLAGADAFLLPSRFEGMPNAALEALACGTPVIATPESGGIAEVAAAAPPGAVRIAPSGRPFVEEMLTIAPTPGSDLRPSLLPPAFRIETVGARFADLVLDAIERRAGR